MTQELATQPEVAQPSSPRRDGAPVSPSQKEAGRESGRTGFIGWLGRAVPTMLVLVALGALGYWGHHTGWKLPKFSELNGTAHAEKDDWCDEHDVPDSICVECNPKQFPQKDYGWCRKHGVHNCTLDHPDAAQVEKPPQVTQADVERAERALALKDRPENNPKCPLYRRRVQFASVEAMAKAGVDVDLVGERPMLEFVPAHGEITFDQTRVARLSSPVPGRAWRVEKAEGDQVKKGDVLALVDAAEVGRLKGEFLQALALLDQKAKLFENVQALIREGVYRSGAAQDVEARAALREAEIRLVSAEQSLLNLGLPVRADDLKGLAAEEIAKRIRFLGLPEPVVKSLSPQTATANLIPVTAPHDGVVVSRDVVPGVVVDNMKVLFVVADLSRMWLTLNVRQEDAKYLALGQPVRFSTDDGGVRTTGQVAWISTTADEKTRTVKVRAELANPDGRLRASTFGAGQIVLREEKKAVVVPSEAVHWDGSCHVVFVRNKDFFKADAPKVFHARTVRPGAKDEQFTEIIVGVLSGEVVASKGSGILRASLLKNNLGAG